MIHSFSADYGHIRIRPMDFGDSELYRQIRNSEDKRIWFESRNKISAAAQQEWFRGYLSREGDYMFSVYTTDDKFVGGASIYHVDSERGTAEFGRLLLGNRVCGQGLGKEVVAAVCSIAKRELKLQELRLQVYSHNISAYKTYLQSGFVTVGVTADADGVEMLKMVRKLMCGEEC